MPIDRSYPSSHPIHSSTRVITPHTQNTEESNRRQRQSSKNVSRQSSSGSKEKQKIDKTSVNGTREEKTLDRRTVLAIPLPLGRTHCRHWVCRAGAGWSVAMVLAMADRRRGTRLAWLRNEDKGKERQTDKYSGQIRIFVPMFAIL